MTLEFDSASHRYTIGGVPVPSVTQITDIIGKPALIQWAVNEACHYFAKNYSSDPSRLQEIINGAKYSHNRKKGGAANAGTLAHKWIEQYINHHISLDPYPEQPRNFEVENAVNAFLKFVSERQIEFLTSEQRVFSLERNYCGTLDSICKIDDTYYLLDFKTSKDVYDEYRLQLAAYTQALIEENKNLLTPKRAIVLINKLTSDYKFVDLDDKEENLKKDISGFNAARELFLWKEGY